MLFWGNGSGDIKRGYSTKLVHDGHRAKLVLTIQHYTVPSVHTDKTTGMIHWKNGLSSKSQYPSFGR